MRFASAPAALAALLVLASPALAQQPYMDPPAPIGRILDAPATPLVSVSPDRSRLLLLERSGLPSIAEVAAAEVRLAGIRIDPASYARSRGRPYTGFAIQPVAGGTSTSGRSLRHQPTTCDTWIWLRPNVRGMWSVTSRKNRPRPMKLDV